ncbi:MAG: hypothetical protein OXC48_08990 [Endozoicomonadaceae bacterium]|nr:hypothetical protein [Endozoicomonadaceae bacterium]
MSKPKGQAARLRQAHPIVVHLKGWFTLQTLFEGYYLNQAVNL